MQMHLGLVRRRFSATVAPVRREVVQIEGTTMTPRPYRRTSIATTIFVALGTALLIPAVGAPAASATVPAPQTFDTTWSGADWGGSDQFPANQSCGTTYTVPAGISLVHVTAVGGRGAPGSDMSVDPSGKISFLGTNGGGDGGLAAKVSGYIGVTPGQVLHVVVATDAGSPMNSSEINWPPAGGWGGGGVSANGNAPVSGGGGGASYVTLDNLLDSDAANMGGRAIDNRAGTMCKPAAVWNDYNYDDSANMLIVAGGGGGGGNASTFGHGGGGGNAGLLGQGAANAGGGAGSGGGGGGNGGTQTAGGTAGYLGANSSACDQERWPGQFLSGGYAGVDSFTQSGSGAGGSGMWGGGAGGRSCVSAGNGGGGGGSSYITPNSLYTSSSLDSSATPYVTIDPVDVTTTTTLTMPASPVNLGQAATYTVTVTPNGTLPQPLTGAVTLLQRIPCSVCQGGYQYLSLIGGASGGTLVNGVATISYAWPTGGSTGQQTLIAQYTGDSLYTGSLSAASTVTTQVTPTPPSVTAQPYNAVASYGNGCVTGGPCSDNISFDAAASGNPSPSVQWQLSTDSGVTFTDVPGATSTYYGLNPPVSATGDQYRAVFTNASGSVTTNAASVRVDRAYLRVIANDKSMPYGAALPTLDATYGDASYGAVFRRGDTVTSLGGTLTCSTTATSSSPPGDYPITCGGNTSPNYTITYIAGTLTVFPATQTITMTTTAPTHAVVGDTYTPHATGGGSGNPVVFSIDPMTTPGVCSISNGVVTFLDPILNIYGNCWIDADQAGDTQYPAAPQVQQRAIVYDSMPTLTLQPVSQTVTLGASATFTIDGTGSRRSTLWYESSDGGGSWNALANGDSYSVAGTALNSGHLFRAVTGNAAGTVTSAAATLTVTSAPTILSQPGDAGPYIVSATTAATATFGAWATGLPLPASQWQRSTDGGAHFTDIPGATNSTSYGSGFPGDPFFVSTGFSISVTSANAGDMFRLKLTNQAGTVYSTVVHLQLWTASVVTADPTPQSGVPGGTATFTASASGTPTPDVQWQVSTDGGSFYTDVAGATQTSLTVGPLTAGMDGNLYRAMFHNLPGSGGSLYGGVATTASARLTVQQPPGVTTDPVDQSVTARDTVTFTAAASGLPSPAVHWQVSTNSGASWSDIAGATGGTLSFVATGTQTGNQFRAVFTNAAGSLASAAATLTVARIPLTIAATAASMTYGGAVPAFPATYTGLLGGDTAAVLTGTLTCGTSPAATATTAVGAYVISCSGQTSPDYAISYVPSTLAVTGAPLTVDVVGSQLYGGSPTFSTTVTGLRNGDPASVVTGALSCSTNASATSPVGGGYPIAACSGLAAGNYAVTYATGALTVTPAVLVVGVTGAQTYGGIASFQANTTTGLRNGDPTSVVSGALACLAGSPAAPPVGSYPIIGCSGLAATNYTIDYAVGSLVVVPAPLTVAVAASQLYGGTPVFTMTGTSGLTKGDDATVISGTLACSTDATATSHVGSGYAITACGGISAVNYAITVAPGVLTVTPAPLTVAVSGDQTYGGTASYRTGTVSGLRNGDTASVLAGTLACTTDATPASHVTGSYAVTSCSGLHASDYTVGYALGAVTVRNAELTVLASATSTTYGEIPTVTASYVGFVNGDSAAGLTTAPVCVSGAGPTSGVGVYAAANICGGAVAPGYTVAYLPATETVEPAHLTVTATNSSRLFGAANGALSATITGFVNGETLATSGVTGHATCTTTAAPWTPAGTAPITCTQGSLAAPNYTFGPFVRGTLTIGYTGSACLTGVRRTALVVAAGQSVCLGSGFVSAAGITVSAGGSLDIEGGARGVRVAGSIASSGANAIRICGLTLTGSLSVAQTRGLVTIGGTKASHCAGSLISGSVTLRANAGGVVFVDNTVKGSLTITGTRGTVPPPGHGPLVVDGNTVRGRISVA
jgi:hypothetical protein